MHDNNTDGANAQLTSVAFALFLSFSFIFSSASSFSHCRRCLPVGDLNKLLIEKIMKAEKKQTVCGKEWRAP